jgi:hypothetical protein
VQAISTDGSFVLLYDDKLWRLRKERVAVPGTAVRQARKATVGSELHSVWEKWHTRMVMARAMPSMLMLCTEQIQRAYHTHNFAKKTKTAFR